MTIDRAIKLLDAEVMICENEGRFSQANAQKLGMEALKRHKEMSSITPALPYPLLPGETKD